MRACVAASARSSLFTLGSVVVERKRDGACRVRTPRARATTVAAAASRSSSRPVMPSTTRDVEPLAHDLGVDALAIDALGDLGELVVGQRRRRTRRGGDDVDAEEPHPQALEPADGPKPPPSAAAVADGGRQSAATPSWRGGERERLPVGGERDRRARSAPPARAESSAHGLRLVTARRRRRRRSSCPRRASSATPRTRARRAPRAHRGQPPGRRPGAGQSGGGIGARAGGRSSCRCAPSRRLAESAHRRY